MSKNTFQSLWPAKFYHNFYDAYRAYYRIVFIRLVINRDRTITLFTFTLECAVNISLQSLSETSRIFFEFILINFTSWKVRLKRNIKRFSCREILLRQSVPSRHDFVMSTGILLNIFLNVGCKVPKHLIVLKTSRYHAQNNFSDCLHEELWHNIFRKTPANVQKIICFGKFYNVVCDCSNFIVIESFTIFYCSWRYKELVANAKTFFEWVSFLIGFHFCKPFLSLQFLPSCAPIDLIFLAFCHY